MPPILEFSNPTLRLILRGYLELSWLRDDDAVPHSQVVAAADLHQTVVRPVMIDPATLS